MIQALLALAMLAFHSSASCATELSKENASPQIQITADNCKPQPNCRVAYDDNLKPNASPFGIKDRGIVGGPNSEVRKLKNIFDR